MEQNNISSDLKATLIRKWSINLSTNSLTVNAIWSYSINSFESLSQEMECHHLIPDSRRWLKQQSVPEHETEGYDRERSTKHIVFWILSILYYDHNKSDTRKIIVVFYYGIRRVVRVYLSVKNDDDECLNWRSPGVAIHL
jgi:hypothetical protein